MKRLWIISLLMGGIAMTARAQDFKDFHMPKASPTTTVTQGFATSFIKINYSRPSMRGRTIFGDLIPYGKMWRTGANAATTITFGQDVFIKGNKLKKGTYALYSVPGKEQWQIMFNKGIHNWGPSGYSEKKNVLDITVPVHHIKDVPVESFTISITNLRNASCDIVLAWSNVSVSIPIKVHNDKKIMAHLDKALKGKKPPYAKAAKYYLSTNRKLEEATKYTDLAIKKQPKAYYLYWLKAEILEQRSLHKKALKAAKKAADLAQNAAPEFQREYAKKYQNLKNKK